MKHVIRLGIISLLGVSSLHAFEYTSGETKVVCDGYVKADTFCDSRKVVADRYGECLYYPYKKECDSCGKDINAYGQYNMSLIESNVGCQVTGPKLWEATPSGVLSFNLYGTSEATCYLPRLIYGYVSLDWQKDLLLIGQYEHPLALAHCAPETISYNYGAPIQAQGLQPQIRYKHRFGELNFLVSALTQVPDSVSNGPDGVSTKYLRTSKTPDTALALEWTRDKLMFCSVFDVKRIRPRTVNDYGNRVNETLVSMIGSLGFHYGDNKAEVNSRFFYTQNAVDQTMLSGYGVATRNAADERTYTNLCALSWWVDAHKAFGRLDYGCFLGCGKNLGSQKNLYFDTEEGRYLTYSLDVDSELIDTIFRVSPRVAYMREPVKFAAELECTGASFGALQADGKISSPKFATNIRLMVSAYFVF